MAIGIESAKRIIEAALLFARDPISIKELSQLFNEEDAVNENAIEDLLGVLIEDYRGRGIELVSVASGYRFQICEDLSPWITRLMQEKPVRYSRALLETLALIAYKQPITRAEIEEVRGVAVSTNIIRTLQEREWVKVIGHRDVPGKPALYATTKHFLDDLNLRSLSELPTLAEIQDLDDGQLTQQLNLQLAESQSENTPSDSDQAHPAATATELPETTSEDIAETIQPEIDTVEDASETPVALSDQQPTLESSDSIPSEPPIGQVSTEYEQAQDNEHPETAESYC